MRWRRGHGTQVPVLVPLLSNALFVDVLEAVHKTLFAAGFQTMIGVTHYDPREEMFCRCAATSRSGPPACW